RRFGFARRGEPISVGGRPMKWAAFMIFVTSTMACGGPPKDRPLVPGYGRASPQQCTAAVDNYFKLQKETRRARHVFDRPEAVSPNLANERDERIELCQTEAKAAEAECVANSRSLGEAEECAPTWTW